MTDRKRGGPPDDEPITPSQQPLIAVFLEEDGREVDRYFTSEEEADAALPPDAIEQALALAGAWADLDWDEAERELTRMRQQSKPSAPIEL